MDQSSNPGGDEHAAGRVAAVTVLPNAHVGIVVARWPLCEALWHLHLDAAGKHAHAAVRSFLNAIDFHAILATAAFDRIPAVGVGGGR